MILLRRGLKGSLISFDQVCGEIPVANSFGSKEGVLTQAKISPFDFMATTAPIRFKDKNALKAAS
ncbi:hypothetical protein D3C86_1693680 [compost metagenome]